MTIDDDEWNNSTDQPSFLEAIVGYLQNNPSEGHTAEEVLRGVLNLSPDTDLEGPAIEFQIYLETLVMLSDTPYANYTIEKVITGSDNITHYRYVGSGPP